MFSSIPDIDTLAGTTPNGTSCCSSTFTRLLSTRSTASASLSRCTWFLSFSLSPSLFFSFPVELSRCTWFLSFSHFLSLSFSFFFLPSLLSPSLVVSPPLLLSHELSFANIQSERASERASERERETHTQREIVRMFVDLICTLPTHITPIIRQDQDIVSPVWLSDCSTAAIGAPGLVVTSIQNILSRIQNI